MAKHGMATLLLATLLTGCQKGLSERQKQEARDAAFQDDRIAKTLDLQETGRAWHKIAKEDARKADEEQSKALRSGWTTSLEELATKTELREAKEELTREKSGSTPEETVEAVVRKAVEKALKKERERTARAGKPPPTWSPSRPPELEASECLTALEIRIQRNKAFEVEVTEAIRERQGSATRYAGTGVGTYPSSVTQDSLAALLYFRADIQKDARILEKQKGVVEAAVANGSGERFVLPPTYTTTPPPDDAIVPRPKVILGRVLYRHSYPAPDPRRSGSGGTAPVAESTSTSRGAPAAPGSPGSRGTSGYGGGRGYPGGGSSTPGMPGRPGGTSTARYVAPGMVRIGDAPPGTGYVSARSLNRHRSITDPIGRGTDPYHR